jgi:hypothetical protein
MVTTGSIERVVTDVTYHVMWRFANEPYLICDRWVMAMWLPGVLYQPGIQVSVRMAIRGQNTWLVPFGGVQRKQYL